MKISILIPTRDRLQLLKYAVTSALNQSYDNIEVVVSDNNSAEPAGPWLNSLVDPRIKYIRHDKTLPVTDNWNLALAQASGDYVVMLGDDDALCDDYCEQLMALVARYDQPECLYLGAYLFIYPGVIPGKTQGMLYESRNAVFWRSGRDQYLLNRESRLRLVNDAMQFYNSYGFNMQFVALHRDLIQQLSQNGDFYQSPYPDYYAMNNVMLHAQRVVVSERPAITIGVSPKSFGWYFQNNQESAGNEHLNIDEAGFAVPGVSARDILPGTSMNTHWLIAIATLKEANRHHPHLCSPSIHRYRHKQILYFALLLASGHADALERDSLIARLNPKERAYFMTLRALIAIGVGRPWLFDKLHVISQKRPGYLLRALARRLGHANNSRDVDVGKNILDVRSIIDAHGL